MYQRGEISEDDDKEAILEKLMKNIDNNITDDISVSIIISGKFKSAIEDEIKSDRLDVAVCLAGVYIEQITNEFYHTVLQWKYELSNKSFNECMKCVPIEGKLTWLFILATSMSIDSELISRVMKICSARNRIAHYKPKTENINDMKMDDKFNKDELISVLEELKKVFNNTIDKLIPEIPMGKKLYDRLNGNEIDNQTYKKIAEE